MKQDFISNVDKSLKIFANYLKDGLFNDIKSEIFENTNKIMGGISTLNANDNIIIGNQAIGISQLSQMCDSIEFIKSFVIQQQIEENTATNASVFNPLDLLRDFSVSVNGEDSINLAIKYSSKSDIMSIKQCRRELTKVRKHDKIHI